MFPSSVLITVCFASTVQPLGVGLHPSPLGFAGSAETTKAAQGISLHRRKLNTHPHFRLAKPMDFCYHGGGAEICCVGGHFTCIGAWGGANSSRPAFMLLCLVRIFYTISLGYASDFFEVSKVACYVVGGWVARHGWRIGRLSAAGHKAGSVVGSAPWQSPADRLWRLGGCPRGDCRRCDANR